MTSSSDVLPATSNSLNKNPTITMKYQKIARTILIKLEEFTKSSTEEGSESGDASARCISNPGCPAGTNSKSVSTRDQI